MGNIAVAGGIHHRFDLNGISAGFILYDDSINSIIFLADCHGISTIEDLYTRFYQYILRQHCKQAGVKLHLEPGILHPPGACAIQPIGRILVLCAHRYGQPEQFLRNSEGDLPAIAVTKGQINGHKSCRGKAAEDKLLFQQYHLFSLPRRRQCRTDPGKTTTANQYITLLGNRGFYVLLNHHTVSPSNSPQRSGRKCRPRIPSAHRALLGIHPGSASMFPQRSPLPPPATEDPLPG